MVLHDETLVFVTTAIVATVAEVESGSTFGETCRATEAHETNYVTRCKACWNMFRNAVAHKFQLKFSTCNNGLTTIWTHNCKHLLQRRFYQSILQRALSTIKDVRNMLLFQNSHRFPNGYFKVTFSFPLPWLLPKLRIYLPFSLWFQLKVIDWFGKNSNHLLFYIPWPIHNSSANIFFLTVHGNRRKWRDFSFKWFQLFFPTSLSFISVYRWRVMIFSEWTWINLYK